MTLGKWNLNQAQRVESPKWEVTMESRDRWGVWHVFRTWTQPTPSSCSRERKKTPCRVKRLSKVQCKHNFRKLEFLGRSREQKEPTAKYNLKMEDQEACVLIQVQESWQLGWWKWQRKGDGQRERCQRERKKIKSMVSKRTSKKRTRVPPSEISMDVGLTRQVMSRSGYVKPEFVLAHPFDKWPPQTTRNVKK